MNKYQQPTDGIIDLQKSLLQAMLEKDDQFIDENLHEEFFFTSPRAVTLNKNAFIKTFAFNPDMNLEIFQLSDEKLVAIGRTALLHGVVQVKFANQAEFLERVTFALVKVADRWLTLSMNATFIPEK